MASVKTYRLLLLVVVVALAGALTYYVKTGSTPPGVSAITSASGSAALTPAGQRVAAPDFTGIDAWVNSSPLTLSQLRGKVVLIDFWTFSCVNCVRTLPHLRGLYDTYKDQGLVIVGVHSPEFDFEKDVSNVRSAVSRLDVTWPVAVDSEMGTWNAYSNSSWPAEYLLDQQGKVAYASIGEGDYDQTASAVAALLNTQAQAITPTGPGATVQPSQGVTPELYAGSGRGQLANGETYGGQGVSVTYPDGQPTQTDHILLTGGWTDHGEYVEAQQGAHVRLAFHATYLYVVAGPGVSTADTVTVTVDGRPVPSNQSGSALQSSAFTVNHQDLYFVLSGIDPGHHEIDLSVPPGFQLFTFTFG